MTLKRQSTLARTGESEGSTEGCGSLLPWHWPCALVVEQLTAALELFGRQLRQILREFARECARFELANGLPKPLIENYHARSSVNPRIPTCGFPASGSYRRSDVIGVLDADDP